MKNYLSILAAATFFIACDKDNNTPEPVNEEELITSLLVEFTDSSGSDTLSFSFKDLDGDGGNSPVILSDTLSTNTTYLVTTTFLDETEVPAENITLEVISEGDEHQVFFLVSDSLDLDVTYDSRPENLDVNGNPIGVYAWIKSGNAGSGNLSVILRHNPNKNASGVESGDITNAGGETDIEVTFPVSIK